MRILARSLAAAIVVPLGCFSEGDDPVGDRDDDPGATTEATTDDDPSEGAAVDGPGMPPAVTMLADVDVIGVGQSVTFDVIVAGGDSSPTVTSGRLLTADLQTEIGTLVQKSPLELSYTLSWDELNAARPIEFDTDPVWTFRAEVDLGDGEIGFATFDLGLTCAGRSACDGECIDKSTSNAHCGSCGTQCSVFDMGDEAVGECVQGACTPTFHECLNEGRFANCVDYCASIGQTCGQGAQDQPELGCGGYTYRYYEAELGHLCVDVPDFGWASFAGCAFDIPFGAPDDQVRCCCTQ